MKNMLKKRLKELREDKKLTKTELAKKINISVRTVSSWKNGITLPNASKLIALADFFNCKIKKGTMPRPALAVGGFFWRSWLFQTSIFPSA